MFELEAGFSGVNSITAFFLNARLFLTFLWVMSWYRQQQTVVVAEEVRSTVLYDHNMVMGINASLEPYIASVHFLPLKEGIVLFPFAVPKTAAYPDITTLIPKKAIRPGTSVDAFRFPPSSDVLTLRGEINDHRQDGSNGVGVSVFGETLLLTQHIEITRELFLFGAQLNTTRLLSSNASLATLDVDGPETEGVCRLFISHSNFFSESVTVGRLDEDEHFDVVVSGPERVEIMFGSFCQDGHSQFFASGLNPTWSVSPLFNPGQRAEIHESLKNDGPSFLAIRESERFIFIPGSSKYKLPDAAHTVAALFAEKKVMSLSCGGRPGCASLTWGVGDVNGDGKRDFMVQYFEGGEGQDAFIYIIYNFLSLLMNSLGEDVDIRTLFHHHPVVRLTSMPEIPTANGGRLGFGSGGGSCGYTLAHLRDRDHQEVVVGHLRMEGTFVFYGEYLQAEVGTFRTYYANQLNGSNGFILDEKGSARFYEGGKLDALDFGGPCTDLMTVRPANSNYLTQYRPGIPFEVARILSCEALKTAPAAPDFVFPSLPHSPSPSPILSPEDQDRKSDEGRWIPIAVPIGGGVLGALGLFAAGRCYYKRQQMSTHASSAEGSPKKESPKSHQSAEVPL